MEKVILKKENNEVSIVDNDIESTEEMIRHNTNPCCECRFGYTNKCPKMGDEVKKNIGEYEFISDGYQIYNENGELDSFLITKCEKFEKDPPRRKPKTREELENLKRLKESIKILYYGGVDIEEANRTQADINRRAFIKAMSEEAKKVETTKTK